MSVQLGVQDSPATKKASSSQAPGLAPSSEPANAAANKSPDVMAYLQKAYKDRLLADAKNKSKSKKSDLTPKNADGDQCITVKVKRRTARPPMPNTPATLSSRGAPEPPPMPVIPRSDSKRGDISEEPSKSARFTLPETSSQKGTKKGWCSVKTIKIFLSLVIILSSIGIIVWLAFVIKEVVSKPSEGSSTNSTH